MLIMQLKLNNLNYKQLTNTFINTKTFVNSNQLEKKT